MPSTPASPQSSVVLAVAVHWMRMPLGRVVTSASVVPNENGDPSHRILCFALALPITRAAAASPAAMD